MSFFVSLLQPFWILHGQHKYDGGGHEKSAGQWHLWTISGREGRQGVTCVVPSPSLNLANCHSVLT